MRKLSISRRRSARGRRFVLAGLAGAAVSVVVACWSASASSVNWGTDVALPVPSPSLLSTPALGLNLTSSTPTPTPILTTPTPSSSGSSSSPCPTPVPLSILPTPSGCAAVVPPPPPGATPGPSSGASPSASPGTGAAAPVGAAQPGAASAAGTSPASLQQSSLLQLLGLLSAPPNVGVERPVLQHFGNIPSRTAVLATQTVPGDAPPSSLTGARPHLPPALWLVMLLSLLAAIGLSVVARRGGRLRIARAAEVAAVPFLLVVVVGAVAAVPKGGTVVLSHQATPTALAGAAQVAQVPHRTAVAVSHEAPSAGQALLDKVTTYERQVAHDEAQIQVLTVLAAQQAPADGPSGPAVGPFDSGSDPTTTIHDVAASLEATLQQEYDFFVATAGDPNQAQALLEAAAAKPAPVRQAVAYDVQAVEAQLAQEAAIAQAAQASHDASSGAPTSLLAPLAGPITQPFGPSSLVFEPQVTFNGVTYPHFHTGIDIAGPLDAPIHAAADGVVAIAGSETDSQGHLVGYGNYVVIAHAGRMITLYGHLDHIVVTVGQVVHAGDVIGLEGSTGNSTGPHLHFEVHIAGLLTDPVAYLGDQLKAR